MHIVNDTQPPIRSSDFNRDFKQGLRKCLVRRVLAAEKWNEYVESRQNSKLLCTLSKSRSTEVYNLSR